MGRIIRGTDPDLLGDQFHGCVQGRVLIVDGDGPCYRAAATVKRLDTAIRHFQQAILTMMFLTKAQEARVHLTAHDSLKAGRFLIIGEKPYQGNRTGKAKPSLLEPLRQAVALRGNWLQEFSVHLHRDVEADDAMMYDAYRYKEHSLIVSEDKDLRMTPYPYWEAETGTVSHCTDPGELFVKFTAAGNGKCLGRGPLFFWAQMLMGDTADNVRGVRCLNERLCGPAAAYNALRECKTQSEAANLVLDAYRVIDQNPLPEAYLLWLLRWPGDSVLAYLSELALSADNITFIKDCYARRWHTFGEAAQGAPSALPEGT